MQQRGVGKTGEQVSAIGLGCMGLVGWYGERDDAESAATVHRALDIGINHLDTAAVYQDGENERFVGRCIKGRRDEVFIATKCGMERTREGRIMVDNRPEIIRASCDTSLQRLGIERIDLFYVHRVDPLVPVEETMGAMAELVDAGKIKFVGVSEVSAETLQSGQRGTSGGRGAERVVIMEPAGRASGSRHLPRTGHCFRGLQPLGARIHQRFNQAAFGPRRGRYPAHFPALQRDQFRH